MIFDDRQDERFPAESFYPALASAGEDVPKVVLPCGIAIKFVVDDREFTWAEYYAWGVPLEDIAELAGENSFSYNTWPAEGDVGELEVTGLGTLRNRVV